jgi:hypothetical protein
MTIDDWHYSYQQIKPRSSDFGDYDAPVAARAVALNQSLPHQS